MQTLRSGQWLNDEVINYFLKNCLAMRDVKMCARDKGRRHSHFFNIFFIQHMFDEKSKDPELKGRYNFSKSKKVPGKDIFNLKYIIQYYDSLAQSDDSDGGEDDNERKEETVEEKNTGISNKQLCMRNGCKRWKIQGSKLCNFHKKQLCKRKGCFQLAKQGGVCVAHSKLEGLLEYVKDEYRAKKGQELDVAKWELVSCAKDTPQQRNGYDCGVFTCMFADFISKDCQLLFNQDHIDCCRNRIALSIALSIIKNCAIDDSD
ncbi:hypothetical protein ACHAW5_003161 [Stephanodiscus triporus]|uniref:Ubiquitin-like protease family profile domain-containing protein n=1 Tax=Stephanodiscus triporus TaxID=2934178 RepID=A0ABD3MU10_9STRA